MSSVVYISRIILSLFKYKYGILDTCMKKLVILLVIVFVGSIIYWTGHSTSDSMGAPPYGASYDEVPDNPFELYRSWRRPDVPAKVGLQVGHWKNEELPEELEKLIGNTGAQGGGKWEWEVNYEIVSITADILRRENIQVDILPATVPEDYWADIFLAVHADGSTDTRTTGYKFAAPWRDFTGKSQNLVTLLESSYEKYTDLKKDPNITRNMRGYYAFSWWKYDHAIHPMTTAAIAETGFLTNYHDQQLLLRSPEIPATAIAEAIIQHLTNEGLL